MRSKWLIAVVLLMGCSTHPIVDVRDCLYPGRLDKNRIPQPYGGVCVNQGIPTGLPAGPLPVLGAPGVPGAPTPAPFPTTPTPGVVPPALPLPGQVAPPAAPGLPPPTPFSPATNPLQPPPIPIR